MSRNKWLFVPLLGVLGVLTFTLMANAEEKVTPESAQAFAETVQSETSALWTCLAAFLVFFMQAGFTLVEAGFTRAKNACNIIMKNVMDFSIGALSFWMVGFGLMFGVSNGMFGTTDFFYEPPAITGEEVTGEDAVAAADVAFNWAFLIFQTVFCATAATIVSGAMAERTKYIGYLCYTIAITVIVYPVFGSWAWNGLYGGGGWLEGDGLGDDGAGKIVGLLESICGDGACFADYAGSTVVHSIGGWAALAGAIVIGPRLGKFGKDGRVNAIPGHNIPMAALGVFILWLGWFGFNPGSTTAIGDGEFAFIAVTTNLAAAAGAVSAMIVSWILFKRPDTSFTLNGALAGLVSITAGCYNLSPFWAIVAGLIGGALCVVSVLGFEKLKIDDPVGAVSVHGVCGAWGTIAVGLFATENGVTGLLTGGGTQQLFVQVVGVLAGFIWAFPVSLAIFLTIKYTIGLRVTEQEEMEGLDITEHGMHAYPSPMVGQGVGASPVAGGAPAPATAMMTTPETA